MHLSQPRLFNSLEQLFIQSAQDEFFERRLWAGWESPTSTNLYETSGTKSEEQPAKRHSQTGFDRHILDMKRKQGLQSANVKKMPKIANPNENTSNGKRFLLFASDDGTRKETNT